MAVQMRMPLIYALASDEDISSLRFRRIVPALGTPAARAVISAMASPAATRRSGSSSSDVAPENLLMKSFAKLTRMLIVRLDLPPAETRFFDAIWSQSERAGSFVASIVTV